MSGVDYDDPEHLAAMGRERRSSGADSTTNMPFLLNIQFPTGWQNMHPVSLLNELCLKMGKTLSFATESVVENTTTEPCFCTVAKIDDYTFPPCQARNKKDSRRDAAQLALSYFSPTTSQMDIKNDVMTPSTTTISTSSSLSNESHIDVPSLALGLAANSTSNFTSATTVTSTDIISSDNMLPDIDVEPVVSDETITLMHDTGKNPVSLVFEYYQKKSPQTQPSFEENVSACGFSAEMVFENTKFTTCYGRTKKKARERAALAALDELVRSGDYNASVMTLPSTKLNNMLPKFIDNNTTLSFHQILANEVNGLLYSLAHNDPLLLPSAKVSAAIIGYDHDAQRGQIISFGTGTRTINGNHLVTTGLSVNDSHAEVLARRGFVRWLYSQLNDRIDKKACVFADEMSERNRLVVSANVTFHLYVSTAPCGDGRVFCIAESEESTFHSNQTAPTQHQPLLTDPKKHALIRSKIESGEGTIPVFECASVQTLDGITGGERLRTMSCSDKVLKWNVMGLQGTLLSAFIEPVYLSSIIIGTLFHHGHLSRAVCCRMSGLETHLQPLGHIVNHPMLICAGLQPNQSRDISKSSTHCANYNLIDGTVEYIDGGSGRSLNGTHSRLAKAEMYTLYKHICSRVEQTDARIADRYITSKQRCVEYTHALALFRKAILERNYGWWLGKPREEKLFE